MITSDQLKAVIEVDDTIDTTPFIQTASELVAEYCSAAGYTAEKLARIETYLAAHFYALRDRQTISEQAGTVSVTYQSKIGLFLKLTHYGQTAMMLDGAGGLAALDKKMENGGPVKAGFTWLGTGGMFA